MFQSYQIPVLSLLPPKSMMCSWLCLCLALDPPVAPVSYKIEPWLISMGYKVFHIHLCGVVSWGRCVGFPVLWMHYASSRLALARVLFQPSASPTPFPLYVQLSSIRLHSKFLSWMFMSSFPFPKHTWGTGHFVVFPWPPEPFSHQSIDTSLLVYVSRCSMANTKSHFLNNIASNTWLIIEHKTLIT